MNESHLRISDYNFHLPEELIPGYPLAERDASRLLIYKHGNITEARYLNLPDLLPTDSLLIVNDSKVVAARILFQKPTGGVIEIFCLEPAGTFQDVQTALLQRGCVEWKCLVGGASKWKKGQVLHKELESAGNNIILGARYLQKEEDSFMIRLSWSPDTFTFAEILDYTGAIPLPPYLKRNAEATDSQRYQTIFAEHKGSVAAPTAGLHFTPKVLDALRNKGVTMAAVTLHVGAGTFLPVKTNIISEHSMHAEWLHLPRSTIEKLINNTGHVAAVGTTSLRTLESLYHIGRKIFSNPGLPPQNLHISQWEAYEPVAAIATADALSAIVTWMEEMKLNELIARTQLMIIPGYRFRVVDILITNFHQPHSTLLLLVAAFIGEDWKKVYEYAVEKRFRFLSYGDGCLLFRNENLTK
jgi:S-adenosylmethionine:tRNA ribosyltransferase-isomerase